MYKIYFNETPLILISKKDFKKGIYPRKSILSMPYLGKTKMLLNYVDQLEKSNRYEAIIVYSEDLIRLYKDFKSLFEFIKAAGGLVINENHELLMIYRRGYWDLPKGKLDNGEKYREAAIREVKEECGFKNIILKEKLIDTYHVYNEKGIGRVLKKTRWYLMESNDLDLIPQIEEDIHQVKWRTLKNFLSSGDNSYQNIFDVLFTFYQKT